MNRKVLSFLLALGMFANTNSLWGQVIKPGDIQNEAIADDELIRALNIARHTKDISGEPELVRLLKSQIDLLSRSKSELVHVQNDMEERLAKLDQFSKAELEKSASELSLPVYDRETADLLIRNCLMELQRIDWDLAAEKELAKTIKDTPQSRINTNRVAAAAAILESARAKLDISKTKLAQMEELQKRGNISAAEVQEGRAQLAQLMAGFKLAEIEYQNTQLTNEAEQSEPIVNASRKIQMLESRRISVRDQLEKLRRQRGVIEQVGATKNRIDTYVDRTKEIDKQVLELELQLVRRNSRFNYLQEQLRAHMRSQGAIEEARKDAARSENETKEKDK